MTVKELRAALEPYGTPYRSSMNKDQLERALQRIRENEERYGQAERPFGVYLDEETK